jgi:hypothetical protein
MQKKELLSFKDFLAKFGVKLSENTYLDKANKNGMISVVLSLACQKRQHVQSMYHKQSFVYFRRYEAIQYTRIAGQIPEVYIYHSDSRPFIYQFEKRYGRDTLMEKMRNTTAYLDSIFYWEYCFGQMVKEGAQAREVAANTITS